MLIGLETSRTVMERQGGLLVLVSGLIQAAFVLEIVIRMIAYAPRVHEFFRDGWNLFDFSVVALPCFPRRPLRHDRAPRARSPVSRLVSVWPDLRLIIGTMLRSIPRWVTSSL